MWRNCQIYEKGDEWHNFSSNGKHMFLRLSDFVLKISQGGLGIYDHVKLHIPMHNTPFLSFSLSLSLPPTYLVVDPGVEESTIHWPLPLCLQPSIVDPHGVIIREDGSVLSDHVKQVNTTGLNCLTDVVVGCGEEEGGREREREDMIAV
jgi:hypothetical protein